MLYETEGISALIKKVNCKEAIDYLTQDVETLAELFNKTYEAMNEIGVNILANPTIGSSIMTMFKNIHKKSTDFAKLTKEQHDFI